LRVDVKERKIRLLLNEIEIEVEVGWLQFGRAHYKENFFKKKKKRMCQKILRRQNKGDYCNEKIIK